MSIIIIKNVPAEVCENCGEYYLSEQVTETVLKIAEKAAENKPEVEIYNTPLEQLTVIN